MEMVQAAIAHDDVCLVEAGTGVGKTLAYLVPSILSGRQTVVATGTRTLMDQIREKDVPFLSEVLEYRFTTAVLKGRRNYLCRANLAEVWLTGDFTDDNERRLLGRLRRWVEETVTGDVGELRDIPENDLLLRKVTSSEDHCVGRLCPHYSRCFLYLARVQAMEADLILTNHHLFFADMMAKEASGIPLLPPDANLVLDEAHGIEDVATASMGIGVSKTAIAELARDGRRLAQGADPLEGRRLDEVSGRLEPLFTKVLSGLIPAEGRVAIEPSRLDEKTLSHWHDLDVDLELLAMEAGEVAKSMDRETDVGHRAKDIRGILAEILSGTSRELVRLVERSGHSGARLAALPLNVGPELRERVFLSGRPVILTSATLSVAGDTSFFRKRLQIPEGAEEVVLESPFDYDKQVFVYAPDDIPQPGSPGWESAFSERVEAILKATKGRAFVLFTSRRHLEMSAAHISTRLRYPILVQGSAPRDELIRQFKTTKNACLFGTSTFWEGVDVVGEALSCVIIDRLPFDPPDDPVFKARSERVEMEGGNAFKEFSIPLAVVRLRQGFGRLIRSRSDRGIVAILDSRIRTKTYGKIFLNSLPPAPVSGDLGDLREWARRELKSRKAGRIAR